ncbi:MULTISPECIES: GGDEF domain-containing phosphodiesterase [Cyanophyceae]|uniref:putative bifunctional diguanylate cyclase/phosphodiesterase n=1 Tax=Cyanophyceae TaxID=3028117 RepID=UPI00168803F2|nr:MULTISPECIES: GGDEF domain-containing phosphodiesterase [Cyanophyceae]MBD1917129.1 EAL domain-containing protein [Phormidium sp. FACHB-77]MBD2030660.1 EAL domain-containing protein [Phormidium sp. FACHB-322]MBD2050232.1 EAL domain-containing protein [Leptolyngbya sp. FACHB-60]
MSQPLCLDAEIYLAVLSALPDAVVVADLGGALLFCNAAAETLLPGGIAGLGGSGDRPDYQVLDQQQWPLVPSELPLGRVLAGQHLHNEEFILAVGHPHQTHWVACSGSLSSGMALLTLRDISAAKQQEASLVQQAFYDPLTGLPNRHLFVDRLGQALACAQDNPQRVMALLVIGLERFKLINDNLGHQVGDEMLVELGTRLQAQVGPDNAVARLGGDEFAILLDNLTSYASAIALTETIHAMVQQPFGLQQVSVNASIGVAFGAKTYQSAFDWLRDADAAMDQVKDHPDRAWQVFDSSLRVQKDLRLQTEVDLRQAIDRGELRLHYQPIVTISNEEIRGFEALVRWQHPTRGLLMPGEFIDVAEASGLIIPLGWWVLTEACRQMQVWTEQYPAMAEFTVSVNMSSKQFSQQHLVEKIQKILLNTGFVANRLKIELTEGVLIDHSDSIIATLQQIRALGIKLLVDDFGTGYSSLSYLHRFPFDCLKIDRSFIENADQDFEKLEILQSVVRLAWNLGLDVVAEGVETSRHHAQLKALRCELGQGYLYSRPLAPDAVEAMMAKKAALLSDLPTVTRPA